MAWTIRQINETEAVCILPLLDQVQAIHAQEHPEHWRTEYNKGGVLTWLRDWLLRDGTTSLMAFAPDGSAVGYLIFELEAREATLLTHAHHCGMLHHVAVDREWRRVGVGSVLIAEMKARLRAQGTTHVRTTYAAFNTASAALMCKAGLEPFHITAEGPA